MVHALGSESLNTCDQALITENDFVSTGSPRRWLLGGRSHRADQARAGISRESDRTHSNSAPGSLHQNRLSGDVSPDVDRAVRRNTRNPKTSTLFRRYVLRERCDMVERHHGKLCGRPERAIGLRAVTSRSSSDPFRRYAITD